MGGESSCSEGGLECGINGIGNPPEAGWRRDGRRALTMKVMEILVVDDEQSICLLLHDVLERFGHRVTTCQDGGVAVEEAGLGGQFDLIFLDIRMPGMGGLEALKKLRELQPEARFVMITGFANDEIIEEALHSGASACLCKPFSLLQVSKLVEEIEAERPVPA